MPERYACQVRWRSHSNQMKAAAPATSLSNILISMHAKKASVYYVKCVTVTKS